MEEVAAPQLKTHLLREQNEVKPLLDRLPQLLRPHRLRLPQPRRQQLLPDQAALLLPPPQVPGPRPVLGGHHVENERAAGRTPLLLPDAWARPVEELVTPLRLQLRLPLWLPLREGQLPVVQKRAALPQAEPLWLT